MKFLGRVIEECFLTHRLRSTISTGIIGGLSAIGIFSYRFYIQQAWSWNALMVAIIIVSIRLAVMG